MALHERSNTMAGSKLRKVEVEILGAQRKKVMANFNLRVEKKYGRSFTK